MNRVSCQSPPLYYTALSGTDLETELVKSPFDAHCNLAARVFLSSYVYPPTPFRNASVINISYKTNGTCGDRHTLGVFFFLSFVRRSNPPRDPLSVLPVDRAASGSRRRPRGRLRARARNARGERQVGTLPDEMGTSVPTLAACKRLQLCYNRPQGPHSRVVTHSHKLRVRRTTRNGLSRGRGHTALSPPARRPILSWPCRLRSSRPTYPSPSPVARPSFILLPSAAHP